MQANEVIKNLMAQKEITQTEMREKMEMKSQSGVSQALNRDMKISMLIPHFHHPKSSLHLLTV